MKFTLVYDGELRSNDDYRRKWEIRNKIHPQLMHLWSVNPTLRAVNRMRYLPTAGFHIMERHHSFDSYNDDKPPHKPPGEFVDTCESIQVGNRSFLPLVRDSLALKCGLKIIFMRQEEPGRVFQGGDMDNRLKTLFDALSVPNRDQIVDDQTISDPIHCLMENDSMISSLSVETHRLLAAQNASKHEVHLLIEVDVGVTMSRNYNFGFIGN